jgi:hypothetical protein
MDMSEEQMRDLVKETFQEADSNSDGLISLEEYKVSTAFFKPWYTWRTLPRSLRHLHCTGCTAPRACLQPTTPSPRLHTCRSRVKTTSVLPLLCTNTREVSLP